MTSQPFMKVWLAPHLFFVRRRSAGGWDPSARPPLPALPVCRLVGALLLASTLGGTCLGRGGLPPPLAAGPRDPAAERSARTLYERAVMETGERRYEAAYAAFDSVVELYPATRYSTISLRERGITAYRLGRHPQAAADLRRLLEEAPDYETTDTAIVLAASLGRMGEPAGALHALTRYVSGDEDEAAGAGAVVDAIVRKLEPGAAARLVGELPPRPYLGPLYVRAADEVRPTDPDRAQELLRAADRLGSRRRGTSAEGLADARRPPSRLTRAVGAILPQTGPLATVARDVADGARLALAEIAAGGGPSYSLEVVAEQTAAAAGTLLEQLAERGVGVVIGPLESEAALTAARVAVQRDVLLVSPTATDTALLSFGPEVITLNATSPELGQAMGLHAARQLRLLRVAVIGSDDEYGMTVAKGFRSAFQAAGGTVVVERFFSRGSTHFGAALREARLRGAQALFLPTRSENQVLTVISQIRYYSGGSFRLLGTEVFRDESFLRRAAGFAEGAYFVDTFSPDRRATRYWDFRTRYFDRYGRSPANNFPAWGYDAVMLALRYLSGSGETEREATYVGAAATYRIGDGRVEKVPVISRIEGAAPVLVSLGLDAG